MPLRFMWRWDEKRWVCNMIMLGVAAVSVVARSSTDVSCISLKEFKMLWRLRFIYIKYSNIKVSFYKEKFLFSNFFPALYHDIITTFWIKKYEISLSCLSSLQGCTTSSTLYNNKAKNKNLNNADLWQRIVIRVVKMPSLDYYLYFWIYCVFSLCFMNRSDKNLH